MRITEEVRKNYIHELQKLICGSSVWVKVFFFAADILPGSFHMFYYYVHVILLFNSSMNGSLNLHKNNIPVFQISNVFIEI